MGHDHGATSAAATHRGRLAAALVIALAVFLVEVVGGIVSGSLAVLADAGHMLTDIVGLSAALTAIAWAQRTPSASRTFGNYRIEILAALLNGVLLCVVAALVVVEAIRRLGDPPATDASLMLVIGIVGIGANLVALQLLRPGQAVSLNIRGAYLEVLGDLLGSIAVVVAAIVMLVTDWGRVDAVASLVIVALMLPRAIGLLRATAHVLLEGSPDDVVLDDVRQHLLGVHGVIDVHDLHVWSITSGMPVMSAHIVVAEDTMRDGGRLLDRLGSCLAEHFDVEHSTFQLEPAGHDDHEGARHT
ncbi:MAG: cation diffusion facilitator family transporter [Candidatus Nanopelagicales bacterium]